MGKKSTDKSGKSSKAAKPAARKSESTSMSAFQRSRQLVAARFRLLLALAVVGLLGYALHSLWQHYRPMIVSRDRYLVPGQRVTVSPPPAWLTGDVCSEVVRDAGLDRRLSILDDDFVQAIEMHSRCTPGSLRWIASRRATRRRFTSS